MQPTEQERPIRLQPPARDCNVNEDVLSDVLGLFVIKAAPTDEPVDLRVVTPKDALSEFFHYSYFVHRPGR
jgi:hypothetical protein